MHTELFSQYLSNNGGVDTALPALFFKVPDVVVDDITVKFSEAFTLNFATREIGFETEELFALKLEAVAQRVLPSYITILNALSKISTSDVGGSLTSEFVYPDTGSDSIEAQPSALRGQTAIRNEESATEQARTAEDVFGKQREIWEEIFAKFENLFLMVY